MAAKHSARAGAEAAARTGPERTEPREHDPDADPAQVLRDGFGDAIAWERSFRHVKGHDGETIYVDEATGQCSTPSPD